MNSLHLFNIKGKKSTFVESLFPELHQNQLATREVLHIKVAEKQEPEAPKKSLSENKIKNVSELKFIDLISLPTNKNSVELYPWSENDYIERIQQVCYESSEIAFKQLIVKIKTASVREMEIIKKLGRDFKDIRPDYFYIFETAYKKAKGKHMEFNSLIKN